MKKVVKLDENDLKLLAKRIIKESEQNIDKAYRMYQEVKSIDHTLADMINKLHASYGLGVDSTNEYLKYMADHGHKLMALLRKSREITDKVIREKYEDVLSIVNNGKTPTKEPEKKPNP